MPGIGSVINPIAIGVGLAGGIAGLIGKGAARRRANREMERLIGEDPTYQRSQYAGKQLGVAQQLFSGRMAGASDLQKNIMSNQANLTGQIDRNATDSSQALALLAGTQGGTNQALQNLQTQEAQNKYSLLDNLNAAYGVNRQEDINAYQDQVRRFGDKVQLKGGIAQNQQNQWGDIGNFGLGVANIGLSGGFKGAFGGGGARRPNYIDFNQANSAVGFLGQ